MADLFSRREPDWVSLSNLGGADPNGPPIAIDRRDILKKYLDHIIGQQPKMTADEVIAAQAWQPQEVFRNLFNPAGWDAFMQSGPMSQNVEDRRGGNALRALFGRVYR